MLHEGMCSRVVGISAFWIEPAIASASFGLWTHLFRAAEGRYADLWGSWRNPPHLMASLVVYWIGVLLWMSLVPPPPHIPIGCPSTMSEAWWLAFELCSGIVGYDFIFFWLHLAMHAWPQSFGRLTHHARHHELDEAIHAGKVVNVSAGRVVHHSVVDGAFQVLVNIAVQRYTPAGTVKSKLARWLHNVVVTFMLTEAHTSAPTPRIARRLFAGVRDHHLHHTHRGPPYQQFFGYLDGAMLLCQKRRGLFSSIARRALQRYK